MIHLPAEFGGTSEVTLLTLVKSKIKTEYLFEKIKSTDQFKALIKKPFP